jgi:RND family efflux transporter MFP subunit
MAQEPEYRNPVHEADLASAHVPHAQRRGPPMRWLLLLAVLLIAAATWFLGIQPRLQAYAELKKEAADAGVASVSVTKPKTAAAVQELILPGNMQAFSDTAIYARTSGYLKRWTADIGKKVKSGELLAEIDAPELDDQLAQARADHATAEANYKFAESTAARWENLLKTDSVSRQEVDEKRNDMAARRAVLEAARFNVARLEKLQSYKKLYAPFDGVITARNAEVGMLVDAGGGSKELFHIASTRRMRVYVNVPQQSARDVAPGATADITLVEFPGRKFQGTVARSTQAIDASARTLLAEVDVDNASGELLPGAYAQVHLKLGTPQRALLLPINTLLFRPDGVNVALVQGDKAVLTPIKLGRDFGNEVEVVSGIAATDTIIVNPSDSLASGAQVRVVQETAKKE